MDEIVGPTWALARLMVITDAVRYGTSRTLERVRAVATDARPGSVIVQLRDHDLSARERLELGAELRAVTQQLGQRLVVNDRLDLALLLGADGVHLGEQSVDLSDARCLLGPESWISQARHTEADALGSEADAVVFSPVIAARKGRAAHGLETLARLCDKLGQRSRRRRVPGVYALGGVNARTARACLDAGAAGVAVIGAVFEVDSASSLVEALGARR
jgi:thiamine-phosphate pyrophosphorylase